MHTSMNISRTAMVCLVLGTAGALFHTSSPQGTSISQPPATKKADMCVVAAGFEADADIRRMAGALREAVGCAPRRAG